MSHASASANTGSGDEGPAGDDTTNQVEALVEQWVDYGRRVLDRVSGRAQNNIKLVRGREYGLDAMLDDVKWFWDGVAEDTSKLVEGVRNLRPRD